MYSIAGCYKNLLSHSAARCSLDLQTISTALKVRTSNPAKLESFFKPVFHKLDSSVGIATRYVLNDPGIESRWRDEIFCNRSDRVWGPYSLLYYGY